MAILSLQGVSLAFGGPKLLDGVDWQIERGGRTCLLGRNGEGKSTLLKLLTGELTPDDGEVQRTQGLRVVRLEQDVPTDRSGTVAEEVALGLPDDGHPRDPNDYRVAVVLSKMGLDPDARFEALSSGMKRRVLLARAIASEPDLLLLDEPTNHLDIDAIAWLEDFLIRYDGTLVFVTHDRAFLARLATRIAELDRGRLSDWACDYRTFLDRKEQLLAAEEQENALFDKRLAQEEVWIRKGIEARRTRNEGRVRALKSMRDARQKRRDRQGTAVAVAQEADRSGQLVIKAEGVSFGYGSGPEIVRDLATQIDRGDKVGIVGPNGAGKSTLLKLLLGQLAPRSGDVRLGTNLEVAYFDQLKATLDEDRTVQQNVSDGYETIPIDGKPRHVLGYLQDFLFAPERSRSLVRTLSGGERSRLLLAKLFTKPSNVLVLDEPTNDLDVETLELLEGLLVNYGGTVLLVSHDRAFLDNVATSILAVEPDGQVHEYDGGYSDYTRERPSLAVPEQPVAAKAPRPKPKKLSGKDRKHLESLPGRIDALEAEIRTRHEAMADPAFYKQDGAIIAEAKAALDDLDAELAEAFEQWESLEAQAMDG